MKIKVAHIQVVPILSGVQNISLQILSKLDDNQYDKYLICALDSRETQAFTEKFSHAGVQIIRLENLKREIGVHDLKLCIELYKVLKDLQLDIVHTHSTKPGVIGRVIARLAGVKSVIHTVHGIAFHNREGFLKRSIYYSLEVFSSLFGHYLTSVNRYYLKYFRYLPKHKVRAILNGVDINVLSPAPRASKVADTKNILFLSRLDEQKDPMSLLSAINILVNSFGRRDIKLTVAGDGEFMPIAMEYVKVNNLSAFVEFLGWVDDKAAVYQQADILCVPSVYEAFGLVFAEAGLYELPTVTTTVEGIPEVVKHGETGILVEAGQAEQLADALFRLIEEPDLRQLMGRNAREHVIDNFNVDCMFSAYLELYKQAVGR
ncbi:glycosyltransferase family 4 protein [Paraglaciecola sp.]|uniref:glycosyltransferase family 4 protein n=1 Tax=Paraglaciecola sp. TaxID=1920173 RepID=UPI003EF35823